MAFTLKWINTEHIIDEDVNRRLVQLTMKELTEKSEMHKCPVCGSESVVNQVDFGEQKIELSVYNVAVIVIHYCNMCLKGWRIPIVINRCDIVNSIIAVKCARNEIESLFFKFIGIAFSDARTKLLEHVKNNKHNQQIKQLTNLY